MSDAHTALYTAAQVRELDARASDELGIPGFELMQRAARASLAELRRRWPHAESLAILCGPGNNGGDGFLLGALALEAGLQVSVIALHDVSHGDAQRARETYVAAGGSVCTADVDSELSEADLIVDALFGSGFSRVLEGPAARLITATNATGKPVLALDVPSGLLADYGVCLGPAIRADATLCFVAWKRGLFTHQGPDCCGELTLARLQLPDALYTPQPADAVLLQPRTLAARAHASHKGQFGHVLLLGGERGFGGAVRLAGEAALRCGAGKLSVVTRQCHVAALLAGCPEMMVHASESGDVPMSLLDHADVLILGPGLGQQDWGRALWRQALDAPQPIVLDADALNMLVDSPRDFSARSVVMTPHPGEAARLLGCDVDAIQCDRFAAARTLAHHHGAVVVLKGAGSLVAAPDGRVAVCPWGNPGMASGGMGDVLSGVIGALLAQGLDPWSAATLGTGVHSRAADMAAAAGQRGLLASDLFLPLRTLLNPQRA